MPRRPLPSVLPIAPLCVAPLCVALALAGCGRAPPPPQVDIYQQQPQEPTLAEIQAAAAKGEAAAQRRLGQRHFDGEGVKQDPQLAAYWLSKAADQDDAEAQDALAALYFTGHGVPRDRTRAVLWWHRAARGGDGDAQASLGLVYFHGLGTPRDEVLAYAWSSLGADNGVARARANRDAIARRLEPQVLARAKQLAADWGAQFGRPAMGARRLQRVGEGTMFLINDDGGAVTAHHVVADCRQLRLRGRGGRASVIAFDVDNDLALLRAPGRVQAVATLAAAPGRLRQGDPVVVFGYPLMAWLSVGGNLTPGSVSAVSGLGNDPNQIQITAAIQPGSSGSPVLDQRGVVVGVVSMRVSDARMVEATGTTGQSLNFAISGTRLNHFLRQHRAKFHTSTLFDVRRDNADIADDARQWTGVIECWK